MRIFHREVYWPKLPLPPAQMYQLKYSIHARQEQLDRYQEIPTYPSLYLEHANYIEYYEQDPPKYTYRFPLNTLNDLVLVIVQNGNTEMFVVTQWINRKSDSHKTLNKNKYVQG